MLASGQNNPLRKLYPVHEGFGRTDALGRIGNTAFGDHLVAANYQAGDAPVSYPYVWNIWKFDWVQYNGSVSQPLARNVGEALGVGAIAPLRSDMLEALPPAAALPQLGGHRRAHAHRTRAAAAASAALAGADPGRGRSRPGGARSCVVPATLPGLPRPAHRRCCAAAGQRAAQTRGSGVAHRSDPAGAHRHGSHRGAGIHRAALRPVRHRPHERRVAGDAAAAAHARAAA